MRGAFGRRDILKLALASFVLLSLAMPISRAADDFIIVQSTTSTRTCRPFRARLQIFTKKPESRCAWSRWARGRP